MITLTWIEPGYESGRRLAKCGEVEVGAVFPPRGGKYWRWRCWIGCTHSPAEGSEKTEAQAKAAVAIRFGHFLDRAGLSPCDKAGAA